MFDPLNLHDGFTWRCFQHTVVAASPWMLEIYRAAKGISPELSGLINIRRAAINQKRAKARVVHGNLFVL